jgi:CDP-glucose 4,6-dehydratase
MTVHDFYRNRRVLVTGITGFKGIWLASWLERLGASLSGLSLSPTQSMRTGWPELATHVPWQEGDVRDRETVQKVFSAEKPEVVFHMAAQPLVSQSYREPVETFAANVLGTVHVLDGARLTPSVRAVVVVTSDKCYENRGTITSFREQDAMGGHDPYSASKGCAELVSAAYRCSFGREDWRVATARAGNVIGGGDWAADRLVPDLVRSALAGEPLCLRNPRATRPWQHVLEPLSGYLLLGARLARAEGSDVASGWNFGPAAEDAVPVSEIARLLAERWGGVRVVVGEGAFPECRYLSLDSTRACQHLHWEPLLTVADRVSWTVDWYRRWQQQPAGVWEATSEQIASYERRIAGCSRLAEQWLPVQMGSSERQLRAA